MLLTITTSYQPATDLGFLLHKSPHKLHTIDLAFGKAHVFYPTATEQQCTAALLLDIDPVGLVRKERGSAFPLAQYVNDRPYVASSFMSVAIKRVFGTLLAGRSKERPELVTADLPLVATIYALPCQSGAEFLRSLFEPLGYTVKLDAYPLDQKFPDWGESPYYTLTLAKSCPVRELLTHLYVLIPVLDNKKHYFIGEAEIEKLLRNGEGWLEAHPEKEVITRRYLRNLRSLSRQALDRLRENEAIDDEPDELAPQISADLQEEQLEDTIISPKSQSTNSDLRAQPISVADTGVISAPNFEIAVNAKPEPTAISEQPQQQDRLAPTDLTEQTESELSEESEPKVSLHQQRHQAVLDILLANQVRTVIDLGCGSGKLLRRLKKERSFTKIAGCDVSILSLEAARDRLKPDRQRLGEPEIELFQAALTYRDQRFAGYDAAVLSEVIEHVELPRLAALERSIFGAAAPPLVIVTTPNREYNVLFEGLPVGQFRHSDHRFEWTRSEFQAWADQTAQTYGYEVAITPIGDLDPQLGAPSQMAIFLKSEPKSAQVA
jgi:2-polyprenyl-3-methyl-5-hydroxy-6-metoxy-1,4-benzoquinol methylase